MGKTDFLAQLDADRLRLLAAIDGLSSDEMIAAPAVGDWTVKSVSSPMSAGSGQLSPASWTRHRYSPTALWEMEQLRAIARFDSLHSHFRRRTSDIWRMVNLSWLESATTVSG